MIIVILLLSIRIRIVMIMIIIFIIVMVIMVIRVILIMRLPRSCAKCGHRLDGYLAQRVPSFLLASSFRLCLDCDVLKGMFPWRTRYPLSSVPVKPMPKVRSQDDRALGCFRSGVPVFQDCALSSYALTCALLTPAPRANIVSANMVSQHGRRATESYCY